MTDRSPIRSEAAVEFLGELQLTPRGRLCVPCAAARLRVEKWAILKLIRETLLAGDVICLHTDCSRCCRIELVAALRPLPFSRLHEVTPRHSQLGL
jgi:hypothetical protein